MARAASSTVVESKSDTNCSSDGRASINLLEAALAPSTIIKYNHYATLFYDWLITNGHSPSTFISLDKLLSVYLHQLYDTGHGKASANATLFGLNIAQPGVSDHLPMSKKALKGFNKLKPSTPHPPLTWPITCIIALDMIKRGHFGDGVLTLLAFDCYLRINEALGLYREDIALGSDVRIGAGHPDRLYIRLRKTKTGTEQGVEVLNNDVKILLLIIQERTTPGHKLFTSSASSYRSLFHRVCDDLKLPSDYVPHSLRHGGATYGYLTGMSFVDIQVRGRWASLKSCTGYVQMFRQALISRTFPPSIAAACHIINMKPLSLLIGEAIKLCASHVPVSSSSSSFTALTQNTITN